MSREALCPQCLQPSRKQLIPQALFATKRCQIYVEIKTQPEADTPKNKRLTDLFLSKPQGY